MTPYKVHWRKLRDPFWFPALLYIYIPVAFTYIIWRTTIINWHIWYGPVLYFAELYGFITTLFFLSIAQKVYLPVYHSPGSKKTVDVLIPTYNESLQVLEPVVLGAKNISAVNQVLVLDDGNRSEVKAMAKRLGVKYYPRLTNENAKAGNLNNGLKYSKAEFLILLDADHIPMPDFIEKTIGYFADEKLAFVQSPQTFYNTNSFLFRGLRNKRKSWGEQMMFYDCIQPAKNRWNSAFFVGTSAMLRRSAIDSVGGFATGSSTEDIHTSIRLHAKGWKSVFLPQALAIGLEADSFKEFYKQRRRWAAGSLGLLFRSADSPLRARGLSFMQRLSYLSAMLAHLQGVQKICFFMMPIFTVFWIVPPVTGNLIHYGIVFIAFMSISICSTWAYSRSTYHFFYNESYSLANMLAHFSAIKGVLKVQKKFSVSRKLTARKERTWLTKILWGMLLISLIGLVRAGWLFIYDRKHYALFIYGFLFMTFNGVVLFLFLMHLRNYERKEQFNIVGNVVPDLVKNYRQLSKSFENVKNY